MPAKSFGVAKNHWFSLKTPFWDVTEHAADSPVFLLSSSLIFVALHFKQRECEFAEKTQSYEDADCLHWYGG